MTPKKLFLSNDYINTIISPFKDLPMKNIISTPLHQNNYNNYNICSLNNDLRFNSTINSKPLFLLCIYIN